METSVFILLHRYSKGFPLSDTHTLTHPSFLSTHQPGLPWKFSGSKETMAWGGLVAWLFVLSGGLCHQGP